MGTSYDKFGNTDKHKLREILYRLKDPELPLSYLHRKILEVYDSYSPSEFSNLYRMVKDVTMCSGSRLRGLYNAVRWVHSKNIPGDIVECGVARGGSAALMGLTLQTLGDFNRKLWLFDTYEGLPSPTNDDPDFEFGKQYSGTCYGSLQDVTQTFHKFDLKGEFIKGLFQDTVPSSPIQKIAVLHIDGDWYESVKTPLENLYEKVEPGGIIQIDDYGYWKGAKKAVDEFFERNNIGAPLKRLDYSGRQFIKP